MLYSQTLLEVESSDIVVRRTVGLNDTIFISTFYDLDEGLFIMPPGTDSLRIDLPLYSSTFRLVVTSPDSNICDTVLLDPGSFPPPATVLIKDHPFRIDLEKSGYPAGAAFLETELSIVSDGDTAVYRVIQNGIAEKSIVLPSFSAQIDTVLVRSRYSSSIKWGSWNEYRLLLLDSLNIPPKFTSGMDTDKPIFLPGNDIILPAVNDPDETGTPHILYSLRSLTDPVTEYSGILQKTDRIRTERLFPADCPDNAEWQLELTPVDSRNRHGEKVSTKFYYNRINEAPGASIIITEPEDTIITSYPWTIRWRRALDPDPGDSLLSYMINITEDAAGSLLLRQYSRQGSDTSVTVEKHFRDNSTVFVHIYALDASGTAGPKRSSAFYLDAVNDPPPSLQLSLPADTLGPGQMLTWLTVTDPNISDSVLVYSFTFTDLNADSLPPERSEISVTGRKSGIPHYLTVPELINHHRYELRGNVQDMSGAVSAEGTAAVFIYSTGQNEPPQVPTGLTPAFTTMLNVNSVLAWEKASDMDGDSVVYVLELSRDGFFSGIIAEISGLRSNVITLKDISNYLTDDTWYFWRVRSEDGWGGHSEWSSPADFNFNRENDAPFWFAEDITPHRANAVRDSSFIIQWRGIMDSDFDDDPDSLLYTVEFCTDTSEAERTKIYSRGSSLRVMTYTLEENALYNFRIKAEDNDGLTSAWSKWNQFFINMVDEPPAPFSLSFPEDGQILPILGQLGWRKTADPDPYDTVTYMVECSFTEDFSDSSTHIGPVTESRLSPYASTYNRISHWDRADELKDNRGLHYYRRGLPYLIPSTGSDILIQLNLFSEFRSLTENALYHWRVRAEDLSGNCTYSDSVRTFIVNRRNEAPAAVSKTVHPQPGQILKNSSPAFFWKPAIDPDPGTGFKDISYEIRILVGDSVIYKDHTEGGITSLQLPFELEENGHYIWQVRAEDNYRFRSDWSETSDFWINELTEAPRIPDSTLSVTDTTFFTELYPEIRWGEPMSVDPGISGSNSFVEVSIRFPDRNDSRIYILPSGSARSFQDSLPFYDNSWGYFRIRTMTADSVYSDWSREVRFGTDLYPEIPTPFNLISPSYGQDTLRTLPKFKWGSSTDPDLDEKLSYTLYICEDSTFAENVISIDGISSTEYQLQPEDELYDNTRYYWKVMVSDRMGNVAWGSQSDYTPWRFNVGHVMDEEDSDSFSGRIELKPLQPNPFSDKVNLRYYLPYYSSVTISVFNLRGQKVAVLANEMQARGDHSIFWDLENSGYGTLSAGMYIFILAADDQVERQKGILIK